MADIRSSVQIPKIFQEKTWLNNRFYWDYPYIDKMSKFFKHSLKSRDSFLPSKKIHQHLQFQKDKHTFIYIYIYGMLNLK